jgi:ribosomal-protein-alanine N-acetyltransferase
MNFTESPVFETQRLILKEIEFEDLDAIFLLRSDEAINKYIARESPKDISVVKEWLNKMKSGIAANTHLYWTINLKSENRLIGTICIWNYDASTNCSEIGFELMSDYQNQGYVSEAIKPVIDFAKTQLQLSNLVAFTHKENISSIKVLEKCNFEYNLNPIHKLSDYEKDWGFIAMTRKLI